MALVLTLFAISVVLTIATAVLLAALFRMPATAEQRLPDALRDADAPRFFAASSRPADRVIRPPVPLEVLLLRIDQHVRLEQAAAESFHQYPTVESLHRRTASPLVH